MHSVYFFYPIFYSDGTKVFSHSRQIITYSPIVSPISKTIFTLLKSFLGSLFSVYIFHLIHQIFKSPITFLIALYEFSILQLDYYLFLILQLKGIKTISSTMLFQSVTSCYLRFLYFDLYNISSFYLSHSATLNSFILP